MKLYKKYHLDKDYTLIGLFREIKKKFNPKKVIYPGCYVHITPSLVFSKVVYIDSFRDTNKFYDDDEVKEFVNKNKEYDEDSSYTFYHQDYNKDIPDELNSFDLIISLFGGFVGRAVKKYLRQGGILVCNDSHGDASMASIDENYELIGVYNKVSDDKYEIIENNLDEYLIPKKEFSKKELEQLMKGVKFIKSPSGYIFRKK